MATVVNNDPASLLESTLGESPSPAVMVGPDSSMIKALMKTAIDLDSPPSIRLLADEVTLTSVFEDFLIASTAADLVESDVLDLRTSESLGRNQLLVTEQAVTALVTAGPTAAALSTEEPDFVNLANEHFTDRWEAGDQYNLRTPARSRIHESLRSSLGEAVETDFRAVLDSLETARGDDDDLDEVTVSLLVAAKNEALLYDISKWGEDVGIASKATFSRAKTNLEDLGVLETEKVPIDVGRPRLRLKFAHESLANASADQLASVANGLVS